MPNHVHGVLFLFPHTYAPRTGRISVGAEGAASSTPTALPTMAPVRIVGAVLAPPFVDPVTSEEGAASSTPTALPEGSTPTGPGASIPEVVRAFKSISAVQINRALGLRGRLWQRNYYERIIRNDDELFQIREYIGNNPKSWECDRENPNRASENEIYDWLY